MCGSKGKNLRSSEASTRLIAHGNHPVASAKHATSRSHMTCGEGVAIRGALVPRWAQPLPKEGLQQQQNTVKERERDTHTQTHTETDRRTDRQTDRERQRERERQRQRQRQRDTDRDRKRHRARERETERQRERERRAHNESYFRKRSWAGKPSILASFLA